METSGKLIREALDDYMPYYFRLINPIIHKEDGEHYCLNENQMKAIMCIHYLNEATPTIISNAMTIQKGSLTTVIKSLIQLKLVIKEYDEKDDRRYYLKLTEEGKAFVKYKQQKIEEELNDLFSGLNEKDITKIAEGFHILANYCKSLD